MQLALFLAVNSHSPCYACKSRLINIFLLACFQVKDYAAELVEPNHAPLSAILRPEDECQLWSDLAASSTCPTPLKQRAAAITSIFAAFSPKLAAIRKNTGTLPEEEILDLIDDLHQTLEALWELEDADTSGLFFSALLK